MVLGRARAQALGMPRSTPAVALILAASSLALGACGGGGDDGGGTAPQVQDTAAVQEPADLGPFLMRKGEEPGFDVIDEPRTLNGVDAFVRDLGLTATDAQRLRRAGMVSFTYQPTKGPSHAGITNVQLFDNEDGAQSQLVHEVSGDTIRAQIARDTTGTDTGRNIRRFTVPGVPSARGWGLESPHVSNVYWVQGRCLLVLGNQGPGDLDSRVAKGVQAIYGRTDGQCP